MRKAEKTKQPKVRFSGFSTDWNYEPLDHHIKLLSGFAIKGDDMSENKNGHLILRGINITEGRIRHSLDIDRYYQKPSSGLDKYLLKKNDLVLGMDGSKVGKNVALISEVDEGSILIQRVARIRAKKGSDIRFIYLNIFSSRFHRYVDKVNTSSGIPHISSKQIKNFKIGFPSFPEQQKIASFLTAVDDKISQLTKKKDLLTQYKKGAMQQLFSQEIRFEDDDGNEFTDWEEKRLGEIASFSKGKGLPKSDLDSEGVYKCIHYGELFLKYGESIDSIISRTNNSKNMKLSKTNDVLMPTSDVTPNGLATASCLKENDIILGGDVLIIRQKQKLIDGVFLAYFIKVFRNRVMRLVSGSTVYHLYGSDMKTLAISYPCLEEQTKIADFLTTLDDKISQVDLQIEKTTVFKKGLLQQMFV